MLGMSELKGFLQHFQIPVSSNIVFFTFLPRFIVRILNVILLVFYKTFKRPFITEDTEGNLVNYEHGSVYRNCFFQSNCSTSLNKRHLIIRSVTEVRSQYFIHVRRGDYFEWPSATNNAVLPIEYYIKGMAYIREQDPKARFIVLSDDYEYVIKEFGGLKDTVVCKYGVVKSIELMLSCQGGILSPSSISLFCAHQIWARNKQLSAVQFFAPRYWAGFRIKKWFPTVDFDWISYIDVADGSLHSYPVPRCSHDNER